MLGWIIRVLTVIPNNVESELLDFANHAAKLMGFKFEGPGAELPIQHYQLVSLLTIMPADLPATSLGLKQLIGETLPHTSSKSSLVLLCKSVLLAFFTNRVLPTTSKNRGTSYRTTYCMLLATFRMWNSVSLVSDYMKSRNSWNGGETEGSSPSSCSSIQSFDFSATDEAHAALAIDYVDVRTI